ncbi:tyrosine-protein kinase receptor Tie-1-like [Patiria miniata]|uniref:EGF-like domain-containing protein n=1 Tax=Patiria miniata TaxID=46514 RepID=A0A914AS18_PATMI|nr:tyrosine-protein kinase receptor Tie-1-like [Patiria miniata]
MQLMALASLILVTVVGFQYVGGDTFHQTMVTPVPYGAGLPGVSLSCIRSIPDIYFGYSFGRPFTLNVPGSASGLTGFPNGTISDNTVQNATTWYLPPTVDATGLFHCRGRNPVTRLSSEVYSIIHSHLRKFEPADGQVTKTINKGENATLAVISANNGSSPVWHRNNEGILLDLDPTRYEIQLTADEVADGDLFVVTDRDAPLDDNHFGMIRLIVRGCVAGKWGPPDCKGVCDLCYNGGVCDDETGDCICPPGFSEPNCLTGKLIAWSACLSGGLSVGVCDVCYNGGVCDDETGDCICPP